MKLEEIEKKNIFEVPEGYFDALPMAIQKRIENKEQKTFSLPSFSFSFEYAFPLLFVTIATVFIYKSYYSSTSTTNLLEGVNTETLVAYLSESEITEEEIIKSVNHAQFDFQSAPANSLETIDFEETTLDKLSKDVENEYF
jgi:hypothetical protein